MAAKGKIYIGTSGFHYEHWIGPFYEEGLDAKNFLQFYSKYFRTVELNNTFYRMPQPQMVERWRDSVPARFIFAAKASRFITHIKKLHDVQDSVKLFLERMELFEKKIGPILFQFPPGWHIDIERLSAFLPLLPKKFRYAFEFRHPSWLDQQLYELLKKYKAAFCINDYGGKLTPKIVTAGFVYIRYHGPTSGQPYTGKYSDKSLKVLADDIRGWTGQKKDVYCYFNNDQAGYAVANATSLAKMVSGV
jgi:uncharacterized protein YecE (DUF72 family)